MKKIVASLGKYWQLYGFGTLAVLLFAVLYVFRLDQPATLAPLEAKAVAASQSIGSIVDNPLYLPHKLLDFAWLHAPLSDVVSTRLASVCVALFCAFLFYVLARRWHGHPIAIFAAVLFGTSGWMLHVGRFGAEQIMFVFLPLCLLLLTSWINTTKRHGLAILAMGLLFGTALFIPAGIWFVLALAVISRKSIGTHLSRANKIITTNAFLFVILCAATMAFAIYRDMGLLGLWLGLPETTPTVVSAFKQWAGSITYIIARGPYMPELWLAHTPVFDVATTAMLVFGGLFYLRRINNLRAQVLLVFFLLGSGMVALHGPVALGFIVVVGYLLVTTGLAYFLHQWSRIFPRNPLAYGLAIFLVSVMVLAAASFHIQRYFIAWQRSPATIETYRQKDAP